MSEDRANVAARDAERSRSTGGRATGDRNERGILTVLCYDLVGSTDLLARMDIEEFQELMTAFQQAARDAIAARSGSVRLEAGDGGIAMFPMEIDAKDAASLAIRAGLDIVEGCRRLSEAKGRSDLHVRVGVATSSILVQEGPRQSPDSLTGAAFAMATRLQTLAAPDTVLVSNQTRNMARRSHAFVFQGEQPIKGFPAPERVWRAASHKREVDRFFAFGRMGSPFIDRRQEFARLSEAWTQAVAGRGMVALVEGEAGIGKSRLLHEVRRLTRFQRGKLLLFQCMPGGTNTTLHPLAQNFQNELPGTEKPSAPGIAEVFRHHGINDPEVSDIFALMLGAEARDPALREADFETIRRRAGGAARRGLEAMCATGPLMLVVEDIHWIDPTSRQLLEEIAAFIAHCPALLVATSRPDAADWLQPEGLLRMRLAPLDPADTRLAIDAMLPKDSGAPPEMLELMQRLSAGVPLFIEEMCSWMAQNAASATDALAHDAPADHASVLENILEARLRALGPAREVARAAAVAGARFTLPLLAALLPEFDKDSIAGSLHSLGEAGLLVRSRHTGGSSFAFRHALIRETIYAAILRKRRQSLHARLYAAVSGDRDLAGWLGDAELGEQAEQAGLFQQAAERFITAGTDSHGRSAMVEARQLLERALALSQRASDEERRDTLRLEALAALGTVLTSTEGPNSEPARKLYEDGVALARGRPASERARWFPLFWGWWFTGQDLAGERARAVLEDLRDVENPEVQLQARHCVWAIDFYLGRHAECVENVNLGLPLYHAGGGHQKATLFGGHDARVCGLAHRGLSQWFSGRPTSALRSIAEARRWAEHTGHVGSIAHAYLNELMLHCYRRDFAGARDVIADIRRLSQTHDLPSLSATGQILEGWCKGNEGDLEQGIVMIRQGLFIHAERQTPEDYPVYCGLLAVLIAQAGDAAEALTLIDTAITSAAEGGHRYWLAELHRLRGLLLFKGGAGQDQVGDALAASLAAAAAQNAVPALIAAFDALAVTGLPPSLAEAYRERAEAARRSIEPGQPLIVNPEPPFWLPQGA